MRTLPSSIPHRLVLDTKLRAERKVFEALARIELEDGSTALHSLRLPEHRYKREGEIDFVVVSPSGVLVLEVKGGGVSRNAHGVWGFTDRWGKTHEKTEGPFEQARTAMYQLRDQLSDQFGSDLKRQLVYGFGVITPDAVIPSTSAEWSPKEILDSDGFKTDADLRRYLRSLLDFHRAKKTDPKRLSHRWVERIVEYMRPRFDVAVPLRKTLGDAIEAQETLTKQQFLYIDALASNDRIMCKGGAGTGKTFLALEVARREVAPGKSVLVTCRSETLCALLRSRLQDDEGVTVLRSDRLRDMKPDAFDTVIVDEGQDLLDLSFLTMMDSVLKGGIDHGRWRIFYDPNHQSGFYGEPDKEAVEILSQARPTEMVLTLNCRNPAPVVRRIQGYTGGDLGTPISGSGVEVDLLYAQDDTDAVGKLQLCLRELYREGVNPSAITILSPRAFEASSVAKLPKDIRQGTRPLNSQTATDFPFPAVSLSSVVDFKGFENDVIILTDIRAGDLNPSAENLLYVAMSRARGRLVMILHAEMRQVIEDLAAAHIDTLVKALSEQK